MGKQKVRGLNFSSHLNFLRKLETDYCSEVCRFIMCAFNNVVALIGLFSGA